MAVIKKEQLLYAGREPLDSRSRVTKYDNLFKDATWKKSIKAADGTTQEIGTAYNGMIVAVWRNTEDTTKNGIYFLHDPNVIKTTVDPDYTKEENWHKLANLSEISTIISDLSSIQASLDSLEGRVSIIEEKQTAIYDESEEFPETGVEGKIYIAAEEKKSYVWIDTLGYLCIGEDNDEPEIICGGSADTVAD